MAEPQNSYNDSAWNYGENTTTTQPTTQPTTTPVTTAPSETTTKPTTTSSVTSGDDGSWWEGKYEGGDTGVDDGQWNPDGTTAAAVTTTTPATTTTSSYAENTPAEWSASKAYNGGDEVSYQGKIYRAKWWTQGENPATNSSKDWQVWTLVGSAETTTTTTPVTEPEETETETETFEVTGTADYDIDMIRDILYVPNGINTAYLEENYVLTGYINDINTEYTQVLVEYGNTGSYDSVYEYGNQRTTMYQNGEVYSYEMHQSVTEFVCDYRITLTVFE